MKTKTLSIFILIFTLVAKAQNYQSVEELDANCASLGFSSNEDAEIAVDTILDAVGLFRNFTIQECPDINNAVAKIIQVSEGYKERFILYDNTFFDNMDSKAGTDWASMSILAHEIAHHLNGHALNNGGSNHKIELEADQWSGWVLAKLGASLEEAQSAIATLRYEKATRTHPAKAERLNAIATGWKKIGKSNPVQPNNKPDPIKPKNTPDPIEPKNEFEISNTDEVTITLFDNNPEKTKQYVTDFNEYYQNQAYELAAASGLKAFQYTNGKEPIYLYYVISSYISAKDYKKALQYSLALLRKGIDKLDQDQQKLVYKNIGLIYLQQDRKNEALQFFDFALRKNPNDEDLLLSRANIYYQIGDVATFKKELEKIQLINPNNSDVLYNLGVLTFEGGDIDTAKQYYKKVIQLNPNYGNAYINMIVCILAPESDIVEKMNSLGMSAVDNKRYDELKTKRLNLYREATKYVEDYIATGGKNTDVYTTGINIYNSLGDSKNAKRIQNLTNRR